LRTLGIGLAEFGAGCMGCGLTFAAPVGVVVIGGEKPGALGDRAGSFVFQPGIRAMFIPLCEKTRCFALKGHTIGFYAVAAGTKIDSPFWFGRTVNSFSGIAGSGVDGSHSTCRPATSRRMTSSVKKTVPTNERPDSRW
jgi:hypothetical protein